jgi:hypothetical protein
MPEAVIAFGPCDVSGGDGPYAAVGSVKLLEDGTLVVWIEYTDDEARDMRIAWPAEADAAARRRSRSPVRPASRRDP